jgi:tRNA-modifying protein YgfZ
MSKMSIINLNKQLSILKISGNESLKFLQGQLCNDLNLLDSKIENSCYKYQFSAHLNHKGRILANFIIINPATEMFYLITPCEMIDKILPRLKMFVLRSKVEIIISSENIFLSEKIQDYENNLNIKLTNNLFLVISNTNYTQNIDDNLWKKTLIKNVIPFIYNETYEKIIPQQINYDLMDAISFTKGCYTGQEIVARTHYLGKVKRRMFKFTTNINSNIEIGQTVVSPNMGNQEVGIVIEVINSDKVLYGLVSLQNDCIDNAFFDVENTQPLEITEIKYSV